MLLFQSPSGLSPPATIPKLPSAFTRTSEPSPGKIVERAISQIISASTIDDLNLLDAARSNYLAAVYRVKGRWGPAHLEHSTGDFRLTEFKDRSGLDDELARPLDNRYVLMVLGDAEAADRADTAVNEAIDALKPRRLLAQKIGALALIPFIGLLVTHAINHHVPLFFSSCAGFVVAFLGIASIPRIRKLALREARHEYAEYYFLFPLFLSISLLANIGFFDQRLGQQHQIAARRTGHC